MRPEDAAAASRHGADAIGVILHPPSRRNAPIALAREIVAAVAPFVTPVGVFVNAPVQEILDTAATLGLRMVQLNGDESPTDVAELAGLNVIKAIRVTRGGLQATLATWRASRPSNLAGIVLEPGGTNQPGGTGVANDWDEVIGARREGAFGEMRLIAAGGLAPDTVAQVARNLQPFAVDVSSGVEDSIGVKSQDKIQRFIEAVRDAEGAA